MGPYSGKHMKKIKEKTKGPGLILICLSESVCSWNEPQHCDHALPRDQHTDCQQTGIHSYKGIVTFHAENNQNCL